MRTDSLLIAAFIAGVGCAHPNPPVAEPTPVTAVAPPAAEREPGLAFDVLPADAELVIDGKSYGRVNALTLSDGVLTLRPGVYQVSLKHPGFATWRAEVAVGQRVERVKVELVKR